MARIVAVVPDLLFASRISETLVAVGHEILVASSPDDPSLDKADLVIADLAAVDPVAVKRRGAPVLGFYPHVDAPTRRRAEAAGVDVVVPRSRMAREMPQLVERLLP